MPTPPAAPLLPRESIAASLINLSPAHTHTLAEYAHLDPNNVALADQTATLLAEIADGEADDEPQADEDEADEEAADEDDPLAPMTCANCGCRITQDDQLNDICDPCWALEEDDRLEREAFPDGNP